MGTVVLPVIRDMMVSRLRGMDWERSFERLKYYTFWLKYWMLSLVQLDKFVYCSLTYLL